MRGRAALARLWHEQRLVVIAFALAVALTAFFGGRMVVRAVYWSSPAHHRQMPEPWMTPGYIARSWHLPNGALDAVLGPRDGGRRSLEEIARDRGIPVAQLLDELAAVLPTLPPLAPGADPDQPPK